MIKLTRLNGQPITLNAELIESVEACPNTVVNLATNNRFLVQESVDEVVEKVIEYRKRVNVEKPVQNPIQGFKRE
ncbi:MAG: flagellar FlbD family protein [Elusimicrobiota bacterium]